MSLPILYSFRRCPYAIRARMAILASGITCEIREVNLAAKPEAMVVASPKATIPVMVLPDGRVLEQSLDIMSYALARNDPENWLSGVNPSTMALVAMIDGPFKVHLDQYKYPEKYDHDPLTHREAGLDILRNFEQLLSSQTYLTGATCSLIDVAIFPFVRQFAAIDETWFQSTPLPKTQAWLADFLSGERFNATMMNFPIWAQGDPVTLFPTKSRLS